MDQLMLFFSFVPWALHSSFPMCAPYFWRSTKWSSVACFLYISLYFSLFPLATIDLFDCIVFPSLTLLFLFVNWIGNIFTNMRMMVMMMNPTKQPNNQTLEIRYGIWVKSNLLSPNLSLSGCVCVRACKRVSKR